MPNQARTRDNWACKTTRRNYRIVKSPEDTTFVAQFNPAFVMQSSEGPYPCTCCSPMTAWEDNKWECSQLGRTYTIVDSMPSMSVAHSIEFCDGNCSNPFHTTDMRTLSKGVALGLQWGDICDMWEQEEFNRLTAEEQQAKLEKDEADMAEEQRVGKIRSEAYYIASKARDHEIRAHCRENAGKKIRTPCKYLYSCAGDKHTGGAKPTTKHITTECWSHSYIDPLTKKRIEKHACWYTHPGEEGWCPEWVQDRFYRPPGMEQGWRSGPVQQAPRQQQRQGQGQWQTQGQRRPYNPKQQDKTGW
jgi:hypothetical protein